MSESIKQPPGTPSSSRLPVKTQGTPASGFKPLKQSQEAYPDLTKYQELTPSKPPRFHNALPSSPTQKPEIQVPASQQPPPVDDDMSEPHDFPEDLHDNDSNQGFDDHEVENEELPSQHDPQPSEDGLRPFDWNDFEKRYVAEMARVHEKEVAILDEFATLSSFFATWSMVTSAHDEDRAVKRLKTREVYIQQSERMLEEKKMHYVQVVEAFKKALELLG